MAARVPIYPVFVVRIGRRRYRLMTSRPIEITRSRNRDDDFARAVAQWMAELEHVMRDCWYQWFTFEPYWPEAARRERRRRSSGGALAAVAASLRAGAADRVRESARRARVAKQRRST